MKRYLILPLLIVVLILAGCSRQPVQKIAVMDMDMVLTTSQRAQEMQQTLTETGNKLEKDYNQKEKELSGEEGEKELNKIYQEYLDSKQQLEEKFNNKMNAILSSIVEEKGIEIVLYKNGVYYGGEDITQEVIDKLDNESGDGGSNNGK